MGALIEEGCLMEEVRSEPDGPRGSVPLSSVEMNDNECGGSSTLGNRTQLIGSTGIRGATAGKSLRPCSN